MRGPGTNTRIHCRHQTSSTVGVSYFIQRVENIRVMIDIAGIGMFAGFYIVPLFALVQQKSDPEHLSRVIAGNNILNAFFMVASAVMAIVLLDNDYSIAQLFLITTVLNVLVAIALFVFEPRFISRLFIWLKITQEKNIKKAAD